MNEENLKVIKHALIRMLARREHGFNEALDKLSQRGFSNQDVYPVLTDFKNQGLQSDLRFANMHVRNGCIKGQGRQRIKQQLNQLNIDPNIITQAFEQEQIDWFELAAQVKIKKFGDQIACDIADKAKQQRFLQYRGFSYDEIAYAMSYQD